MMNTKYSTKYSVTFWAKSEGEAIETRDSIIEDNLTEALRFVRDLWPEANLHGTAEGIFATIDGETVAEVRELHTLESEARKARERETVMSRDIAERELLERQRDDAQRRAMEYAKRIDSLTVALRSARDERDELRRGSTEPTA
jgi:hypothetical protein